mmetsp:Transcript_12548/g.27228  ORF Transcript_12548/g.27228 Transcript_12548/m.27228 type:complete len:99 (-) Transcript_12548:20-316(-)
MAGGGIFCYIRLCNHEGCSNDAKRAGICFENGAIHPAPPPIIYHSGVILLREWMYQQRPGRSLFLESGLGDALNTLARRTLFEARWRKMHSGQTHVRA